MNYPCPCCGCSTYEMPPEKEAGFICPVCFWENDLRMASDTEPSECNHGITLKEARENYLAFHASERNMLPYVRPPRPEEIPPENTAEQIKGDAEKKMEFWDIYDRNKQRTGRTMKRNDFRLQEGEYHLTVLGVVVRPDGKFLITQRAMTKAWAPGWWEVSGGGVQAGEDSADAVKREILEETGLDVTDCEGGYLFTYKRENPGEGDNYFVDVYRFIKDFTEDEVKPQEEETLGFRLAAPEEIRELAGQGIFLHYDSIQQAFDLQKA